MTATWEVDPAATGSIEGTVRTTAGEPIEELMIVAYPPRYIHTGSAFTDTDGHYKITGLAEGSYALHVGVRNFMEMPEHIDQFAVTAGTTLRRDYTVPDIGRIEGRIVGKDGKPLARANARAERNENEELADAYGTADDNGVFVFDRLPPGTYVLTAMSALGVKQARTTVTVRARQTTAVALTINERAGSISGAVVDAANKPVADALVAVVHESTPPRDRLDSRNYRDRSPVVTNSDGSFVITNLPEGTYTLGASRRGSGETATLDNVALGSSIKLQLARGGSIRGTVHSWNRRWTSSRSMFENDSAVSFDASSCSAPAEHSRSSTCPQVTTRSPPAQKAEKLRSSSISRRASRRRTSRSSSQHS